MALEQSMCGILGFTGQKNEKLTKKLLSQIQYRGYDDLAIEYEAGLNFGMNRLAINDLTQGYYPMSYGDLKLVFNGEIYNYPKLRQFLEKKNIQFKTTCDAEVILPLFTLYKEKAFAMLEGMFAICIVDTKQKKIILARDKAGEKPLYYALHQGQLIFSSELKTVQSFLKPAKLERESLNSYFRHGSVFSAKTLLQGIRKIPPSGVAVFDVSSRSLRVRRYWSPQINRHSSLSLESATDQLETLIKNAVKEQLLADVPVGCFLSGGVDSSLISYYACQHIKNLKTYSVAFPDSFKDNESQYAHAVANFLGTDHTEIECTAKNVRPLVEKIGEIIDEPICDPAVLPTYLLSREARKSVRVALTGDGGDELFGGYYRYYKYGFRHRLHQLHELIPGVEIVRSWLFGQKYSQAFQSVANIYSPQNIWTVRELHALLRDSHQWSIPNSTNPSVIDHNTLLGLQYADYRGYLPEQLLMKMDKMAMQNNLETRAPLLNSAVTSFGLSLPTEFKTRGVHSKYILRKVAARHFPAHWAWRPKHGFSVPLGMWFKNELKDIVYDTVREMNTYGHIFDLKYVRTIVDEHMSGTHNHKDKIWSLIVLTKWLLASQVQM